MTIEYILGCNAYLPLFSALAHFRHSLWLRARLCIILRLCWRCSCGRNVPPSFSLLLIITVASCICLCICSLADNLVKLHLLRGVCFWCGFHLPSCLMTQWETAPDKCWILMIKCFPPQMRKRWICYEWEGWTTFCTQISLTLPFSLYLSLTLALSLSWYLRI